MKTIYRQIELSFERLTTIATVILGNSITFIFAVGLVVFWLSDKQFHEQELHTNIGEVILSITFLSLFIIQKAFNRFSGSLHLKVNELVLTHEPANNSVLMAEEKTEFEIMELSKEYAELAILEKKIEVNERKLEEEKK